MPCYGEELLRYLIIRSIFFAVGGDRVVETVALHRRRWCPCILPTAKELARRSCEPIRADIVVLTCDAVILRQALLESFRHHQHPSST